MMRRCFHLIISIAFGLVIVACQIGRVARPMEATAPGEATRTSALASPTPSVQMEPQFCFLSAGQTPFSFTPDSTSVLLRSSSGVQIINLESLQEEGFLESPANLLTAALSPDGETLAWSLEDHRIQLVRIDNQTVSESFTGHTDLVFKLRFSPNGDRLFSASHDTWVRIWDLEGGSVHDAFQPQGADGFPSEVLGIGISPDGNQLGTIPFNGPARVWDLDGRREIAELGGMGGEDTSDLAFSPDGRYVAADLAGQMGLTVWRTSTWEILSSGVHSLAFAFSPDGRTLAYANVESGQVFLSSLDGPEVVQTMEGTPGLVWELFFSPDGALLAAGGQQVFVWRVENGRLLFVGKSACPL